MRVAKRDIQKLKPKINEKIIVGKGEPIKGKREEWARERQNIVLSRQSGHICKLKIYKYSIHYHIFLNEQTIKS